ncbi:MAG: hypothetical protein K5877_08335 [Lachnospiraceae bacterium]|nr:hypothetical protein [Lachnospiraceae bacterium]
MKEKKVQAYKYIKSGCIIFVIVLLAEIFVFNISSWKSRIYRPVIIAQDVMTTDEFDYYSDTVTIDGPVGNVDVDMSVENHDLAYVSVFLTDKGDKYEYETPEYTVCNGIRRSGSSNIYPFGDVHTIQVKVRVDEGCTAHINTITVNAHIPVDIKPIRLMLIFAVIFIGYLIFADTAVHELYYDDKKPWQKLVTLLTLIAVIILAGFINRSDEVLMRSPWPHHTQYQELARSLEKGTVELLEQYVDPRLTEVDNPYDTIMLQAEGISYSMDYAFYDGHYYAYFGIVPELLLYYPYHVIKGADLPNYKAGYILSVLMITGVFLLTTGIVKRYVKSLSYVFYLILCVSASLGAEFVYLIQRPDIYNIPIIGATAFSFIGLGLWLESKITEKKWLKHLCLTAGSFSMALVAGCRPQMLILSGMAVIIFVFEDGFKNRSLFSKNTIVESICFFLPYVLVAIPVCWYNAARFGSIFDFGATYSLTTNDMNNRGFNIDRLLRSLYCYLFQPPVINTDFPFLQASKVDGNYMGRFLSEHTYGGILVANAFVFSLWIGLINGLKKLERPLGIMVIYLTVSAVIIAGFDANCAGVLYRYTCDFAPAFFIAALLLWALFLDRGRNMVSYKSISRFAYICMIFSLAYAFLTFIASGNSVCLENDNRILFRTIAEYFRI